MARLTRAERQALTAAEVLAAAVEEFSDWGYTAVTVDAIAERAGYTRGAVYGNFPGGKSELFLTVAEQRSARYVDEINAALATGDGAVIFDVYLAVRARARSTPGWGRAVVEFGLIAAVDERVRDRFAALRRSTIERTRTGFEVLGPQASFDPAEMATVMVALEAGLDLFRWVDPGLVPDDLEFRVAERLGGWDDSADNPPD